MVRASFLGTRTCCGCRNRYFDGQLPRLPVTLGPFGRAKSGSQRFGNRELVALQFVRSLAHKSAASVP
jgi:hypothetical protein